MIPLQQKYEKKENVCNYINFKKNPYRNINSNKIKKYI